MQISTTQHAASRTRVLAALLVGFAGVALMLIPVLVFARGATAAHARLHLEGSASVMTATAIVALVWRRARRPIEWRARAALISTLAFVASAQLAESGGALAWASDGETVRSPTLHVLHTTATVLGAIGLVAVAASAVAAFGVLVARFAPLLRAGSTMLMLALAFGIAAGSAEASSIVYVKANGIWIVGPDGKHPRKLTSGSRRFVSPSHSATGTIVALGDDNHLYRFSHTGKPLGKPIATWLGLGGGRGFSGPYRVRVSPDGSKVAFTVLHMQGLDQVSGNSEAEGITSYSYV